MSPRELTRPTTFATLESYDEFYEDDKGKCGKQSYRKLTNGIAVTVPPSGPSIRPQPNTPVHQVVTKW